MNFIIQLIDNSLFPIVTFELSKNLKLATDEQLLRPDHRGKDFSLHSHFTQHITQMTTRFLINHV